MRAVWLALLCLIGLATAAAVKIGMAPYASADLSQGVTSAKAEVSPEPNLTDIQRFRQKAWRWGQASRVTP
jgi:hypothetical protein